MAAVTTEDQRTKIRSIFLKFVQLIHPSEILDFIPAFDYVKAESIREKEKRNRAEAAREFMNVIIESDDDTILNQFIVSLNENWYEVFMKELLNQASSVNKEYEEYAEFIFHNVKGELTRKIEPFEIQQALLGRKCLNNEDVENIEVYKGNKMVACREMFARLPARREDWALQFFEVLSEFDYGHLVSKADPSVAPGN